MLINSFYYRVNYIVFYFFLLISYFFSDIKKAFVSFFHLLFYVDILIAWFGRLLFLNFVTLLVELLIYKTTSCKISNQILLQSLFHTLFLYYLTINIIQYQFVTLYALFITFFIFHKNIKSLTHSLFLGLYYYLWTWNCYLYILIFNFLCLYLCGNWNFFRFSYMNFYGTVFIK